jgi:hypothetical protein
VYAEAVEDAFGADIDYAMLVKIYGASNDSPESRYTSDGQQELLGTYSSVIFWLVSCNHILKMVTPPIFR